MECHKTKNAILFLGDSNQFCAKDYDIDAVITDPPYGQKETHDKHLSGVVLRDGTFAGKDLNFDGISAHDMANLALEWTRLAKSWCVFTCDWNHVHAINQAGVLIRFGVWRKPNGAPQFTGDRPGMGWEAVAICHRPGKKRWNGGGKHAFWEYNNTQKNKHPTQKPLPLFVDFVKDFTNPGETIYDPYMGTGTTGVAAVMHGRKFIGIEKNQQYFDVAKHRIEEAENQFGLFEQAKENQESLGF